MLLCFFSVFLLKLSFISSMFSKLYALFNNFLIRKVHFSLFNVQVDTIFKQSTFELRTQKSDLTFFFRLDRLPTTFDISLKKVELSLILLRGVKMTILIVVVVVINMYPTINSCKKQNSNTQQQHKK